MVAGMKLRLERFLPGAVHVLVLLVTALAIFVVTTPLGVLLISGPFPLAVAWAGLVVLASRWVANVVDRWLDRRSAGTLETPRY